MATGWNSSLSTGLKWQDDQHMELFSRMDKLLEAMKSGRGKDEAMKLLGFLDEYVLVHFSAEKKAMQDTGFPEATAHLAEHTAFVATVAHLKGEAAKGVTSSLAIEAQRKLVDWLKNHIGVSDKVLASHLLNAGEKRAGNG